MLNYVSSQEQSSGGYLAASSKLQQQYARLSNPEVMHENMDNFRKCLIVNLHSI